MKKILILLATVCLCGCNNSANIPNRTNGDNGINITRPYSKGNEPRMQVVEIEGHAYIVTGPYNNPHIIHAEHCACKNK